MSCRWSLVLACAVLAWSQSVISVYSGIINYAEGSVFLDGNPVEQRPGRFLDMKPGSELRLEDGRAEVLLTPGVFLRLAPGSAIRMVSNLLADTQVELLGGPAIVDAAEPSPQTSVTMVFRNYQVHVRKAGRYRFDSNPPELRVPEGEAEVSISGGQPVVVASGHQLHLPTGVLMAASPVEDDFDNWDKERSAVIARDNQQISQTPEIASLVDAAQNDPLLYDPSLLDPGLLSNPGLYSRGLAPLPSVGGLGTYPLSPYSLSPYSLYPYSSYPYSLYTSPLVVLPAYPIYRYGGLTRPGGVGTAGYGYRGPSFPAVPGPFHSPIVHPGAPIGVRSAPGITPGHPVHVGGRR